jgi:hypothetical protein
MACFTDEQQNYGFMGRQICVKNTFLDPQEDRILGFPRKDFRMRRSKSAPASPERFNEQPAPDAAQTQADVKPRATSECIHYGVKTLTMKNMPCHCRRSDVLAAIEEVGFKESHDFFYVPTRRNRILGYAFISFPDTQTANEFTSAMTGYEFRNSPSGKGVVIAPATLQGLDENMKHFRKTAVMQTDAKPFFGNAKPNSVCENVSLQVE